MKTSSGLILFLLLIVVACKKENNEDDQIVTISLVETGLQEKFIRWSADDTTAYNVAVKMEGNAFVNPNAEISLAIDPSLIPAGSDLTLLPDSTYTLDSAKAIIATGEGQAQLELNFFTHKIDPYTKYVLPLRLQPGDLQLNASASTVLLRILLSNDFTGAYTDTISSEAVPPTYPFNPAWNFTDSIVQKTLTAANDSTVIMDAALPSIVPHHQYLVMNIHSDSTIKLGITDVSAAEEAAFELANASLQPYYSPSRKYFYIPYNYFHTDFRIRERLKKK